MNAQASEPLSLAMLFAKPPPHYNVNFALAVIYAGPLPEAVAAFEGVDARDALGFVENLLRHTSRASVAVDVAAKLELVLHSEAAYFRRLLQSNPPYFTSSQPDRETAGTKRSEEEIGLLSRSPLVAISESASMAFFAVTPASLERHYGPGWYEPKTFTGLARLELASITVAQFSFGFVRDLTPSNWTRVVGTDGKVPTGRFFRQIFASYSRKDLEVVRLVDSVARSLGAGELRWDLKILNAGDDWQSRILEEIDQADQFQLFWSTNSKRSSRVREEWKYALTLDRSGFVRPVYWESPIPKPPRALNHLHFEFIGDPRRLL